MGNVTNTSNSHLSPISNGGQGSSSPISTAKGQSRFMRELGVAKEVAQSLSRISTLAAHCFSSEIPKTGTLSDHAATLHPAPDHGAAATNKKALEYLSQSLDEIATTQPSFDEIATKKPAEKQPIKSVQDRMAAFKENYQQSVDDLEAFTKEMVLLFGEEATVLSEIFSQIEEIEKNYTSQLKEKDPVKFKGGEKNIADLKGNIRDILSRDILSAKRESSHASTGLKIVANLLRGFKVKRLLNGASHTQSTFNALKTSLRGIGASGLKGISGTERREAYRNIKIIQERSYELLSIEKQVKKTFPLSFLANVKLAKLEKTYQEISKIADEYYAELDFNADEVRSFQDLSIESHRPSRQHLIMYASDILDGASRLAAQKRAEGRQEVCQDYVIAMTAVESALAKQVFSLVDANFALESELTRIANIRGLDPKDVVSRQEGIITAIEANLKRLENLVTDNPDSHISELIETYGKLSVQIQTQTGWKGFVVQLQQENSKEIEKLSLLQDREEKIDAFEKKVTELAVKAQKDPRIGADKPAEFLASDKKALKKQEAEAKTAIQGLFDELKVAYVDFHSPEIGPSISAKMAAKNLTEARNEVLSDKMRWDRPIGRIIEFSGPGLIGKISVEHKMTCLNAGYPSSSFRGREAGPDSIQPNLQKVEIKDSSGKVIAAYTSSATNVEFFQKDPGKRAAATIQQTGEILMGKIDNKFAALEGSTKGVGTRENPATVDVLTTLLLSPDAIRDWLIDDGTQSQIQKFSEKWLPKGLAKKVAHATHMDPSHLERRMLQESLKAWMVFDKDSLEFDSLPQDLQFQELQFKDKDGNIRVMFREKNEKGEMVFGLAPATLDAKGQPVYSKEGAKYVQFDISCYNVGCNKWTKMMTSLAGSREIETIAKTAIGFINHVFKANLPEMTGELGNTLEDGINAEAFEKDTKRYEAKLEKLAARKKAILEPIQAGRVSEFKEIQGITTLINEKLAPARQYLEKAELNYQTVKTPVEAKVLDEKRKEAFREWQQVRDEIADRLDVQLEIEDLAPDVREYLEILDQEQNLHDLFHEVKDQFAFKDYRTNAGMDRNMYTLPSTLVLFGMALGADPHTGCRSGKDRTSLQRMEIGTKVLSKAANHRYLNYREIEEAPNTYEIREQMLLNSGHIDDLARLNIGSSGLNLDGAHGSYLKQIESDGTIHSTEYERSVLFGAKGVFSMILK